MSSSSSSSYSFSSSSSSSAAPLTWPTLSKGLAFEIVEEVADHGVQASDPSHGLPTTARRTYKATRRLTVKIRHMTLTDRVALARFYLTTTSGPVTTFELTHPKSDQIWRVRFDPDHPPQWSQATDHPDRHHFDGWLVEDITDGYCLGVYDA